MLSRIEREYLAHSDRFNANYSRVLRHRIRSKVHQLQRELSIIADSGIMEFDNGIKEFCNGGVSEQRLNQAAYSNRMEPRAGFEPATAALPRRCPTRLGHRGVYTSI